MSLQDLKISGYSDNVKSLSDYPSNDGVTAEQLKAIFDGRTDKEVKTQHNALVDEVDSLVVRTDTHAANKNNPHNVTKEQLGLGNVDNTSDMNKPVSYAQAAALSEAMVEASLPVLEHISNTNNPHSVHKIQVGLGNVDNTSDMNKPVSVAQQAAINEAAAIASAAAPKNHASSGTDYGIGTSSNYGHVRLSDANNDFDSDAESGTGTTPKALAGVNATADTALDTATMAWSTAIAALDTANDAVLDAATAQAAADNAQTTADTAVLDASAAQASADNAQASADTALSEIASTNAALARTAARTAQNSGRIYALESTLTNLNINATPRVEISSPARTIVLPQTAGHGGLISTIRGKSAVNILTNSGFEQGDTGWMLYTEQSVTDSFALSGTHSLKRIREGMYAQQEIQCDVGDVIYVSAWCYSVNMGEGSPAAIWLVDEGTHYGNEYSYFYPRSYERWQFGSVIRASTEAGTSLHVGYYTDESPCEHYYDNIMAINLTREYGAGNEPTQEQCDVIYSQWFEGAVSVIAPRIRSVSADEAESSVMYCEPVTLRSLPSGVYDSIENGKYIKRIADDGVTLLNQPIVTENITSGTLLSYPGGRVYLENALADAGVYTDKISVLRSEFPINELEEIRRVDPVTGGEVILDVSLAVVIPDGLFFTHPGLADGDIVFFTYFYDHACVYNSNTFSYLDSRYALEDESNGKFYHWKLIANNGVANIQLTEVE